MLYRPKAINELRTPVKLLIPTFTKYNGVEVPTYPVDGEIIYVNWKTFQGTEREMNGVHSVVKSAVVTTWFRPDISSNCRILKDGATYEIVTPPENVDDQNIFCEFKVERVKGGA